MEIDFAKIGRIFAAESEEHLTRMEEALLALEAGPLDDKLLEAVFRGAHTIKGNAASLGCDELARFAHGFEELLQPMRSRQLPVTGTLITLLLLAVDAMRQSVPAAVGGDDKLTPAHAELLAELQSAAAAAQDQEPPSARLPDRVGVKPPGRRNAETPTRSKQIDAIRVETQKLDRMLNLAGEIAIAQNRLSDALEPSSPSGAETREAHGQVQRLTLELQDEIMKLRMLPLGPIFRRYLRTVRDIARVQGKQARLEWQGEEVEIDVSAVEHLRDPLMHMIRNAIDHGIESPEKRQALGKDPCGRVTLKACQENNDIVIQVIDDGAGLVRRRIIERARSTAIVSEPETLADADLFRLIFASGFSTADKVTDLSGRGVGMDVVRQNIEELRGSVTIDSRPGVGTTITLRLPLTMAIIEGFNVGVGVETYILPLHTVIECVPMPAEASRTPHGQGVVDLRGEPLPFVRLRDWFQLPNRLPPREHIVVVEAQHRRAGLAVDALYGQRQTVIKPLAKQLNGLPGIAGSAILGSGRVALILDAADILSAVIRSQGQNPAPRRDWTARPPSFQSRGAASSS